MHKLNLNKILTGMHTYTSYFKNVFTQTLQLSSVYVSKNFFRSTLKDARKRIVPAGRIPKIQSHFPIAVAADPQTRKPNKRVTALLKFANKNRNNILETLFSNLDR